MRGRSHGHADKTYTDINELFSDRIEAGEQIDAGKIPTFAKFQRVGV